MYNGSRRNIEVLHIRSRALPLQSQELHEVLGNLKIKMLTRRSNRCLDDTLRSEVTCKCKLRLRVELLAHAMGKSAFNGVVT